MKLNRLIIIIFLSCFALTETNVSAKPIGNFRIVQKIKKLFRAKPHVKYIEKASIAERVKSFRTTLPKKKPVDHEAIHDNVKPHLRDRPVLELKYNKHQLKQYLKGFKGDTIEILFQPRASKWGHLLIRVGDRIYDYGNANLIRNRNFINANRFYTGDSPMYGFVFEVTQEKIPQIQEAFENAIKNRMPFSEHGGEGTENCTSFVTKRLQEVVPELGIFQSVNAKSVSREFLRTKTNVKMLTIYHNSSDSLVAKGDFQFEKL